MTSIYSASVVKIFNSTNSLARFFRIKIIFLRYKNTLAYNATNRQARFLE
jgi:hypothetical protein